MSTKERNGLLLYLPPGSISDNLDKTVDTEERQLLFQDILSRAHNKSACGHPPNTPFPSASKRPRIRGLSPRIILFTASKNSSGAASANKGKRFPREYQAFESFATSNICF